MIYHALSWFIETPSPVLKALRPRHHADRLICHAANGFQDLHENRKILELDYGELMGIY